MVACVRMQCSAVVFEAQPELSGKAHTLHAENPIFLQPLLKALSSGGGNGGHKDLWQVKCVGEASMLVLHYHCKQMLVRKSWLCGSSRRNTLHPAQVLATVKSSF